MKAHGRHNTTQYDTTRRPYQWGGTDDTDAGFPSGNYHITANCLNNPNNPNNPNNLITLATFSVLKLLLITFPLGLLGVRVCCPVRAGTIWCMVQWIYPDSNIRQARCGSVQVSPCWQDAKILRHHLRDHKARNCRLCFHSLLQASNLKIAVSQALKAQRNRH